MQIRAVLHGATQMSTDGGQSSVLALGGQEEERRTGSETKDLGAVWPHLANFASYHGCEGKYLLFTVEQLFQLRTRNSNSDCSYLYKKNQP